MKKLIVTALVIAALGLSGTAVANSAPGTDPNNPSVEQNTQSLLATETVSGIAVPTEVLIYAQTKYQGYAVTQASKTTRDGKPAYSLRVDLNDISTDYDGFYLLYDTSWKPLGEEKITPPPAPRPKEQPKQQPDDEKKPSPKKPRTENSDRKPKKPHPDN